MSKLIEVDLNDQKVKGSQNGLTEKTFYKQIYTDKYPAIYIDLGTITFFSFKDGILTINNTVYNMFSRHIIDIVKAVRSNGGVAWLASSQIALYPALFLDNILSQEYINVSIDKSPILISDFIPDIINNLISIDSTNLAFNVLSVFDSNEDTINFEYISSTHNLYVDKLGTAILQYNINKFFMLLSTERLLTTKALTINPIDLTEFEKSLLINPILETNNMLYE